MPEAVRVEGRQIERQIEPQIDQIEQQIEQQIEAVQEEPAVLRGSGCRMVRLRQPVAGFAAGDLLLVAPEAEAQGGELVVDLQGRVGRYGGGAVWGVIVGAVRRAAAPPASDPASEPASEPGCAREPGRIPGPDPESGTDGGG